MAKAELERSVQQSVLDRLVDDDPTSQAESSMSRSESVRALKEAVRRDLEALLNTRRTAETAPEGLDEVAASVYHFGLPDISSMSRDSPETQARLTRMVEEAVGLFEPRLTGVKVVAAPDDRVRFGELRFVIEGTLELDPVPERISFDTVLESTKGMQVRGDGHA
ncbi:MAG: type VI secretion system baseplate subunit TssE [Gemmatimonadota bacterium]|nr:type VI secretion system baseplate subunit TssE [Gemmatimonadota bacterium]